MTRLAGTKIPATRPSGDDEPARGPAASGPDRVRVLVFPCGAESAGEIHQALRFAGHVELFGASSVDDHGRFRFERYFGELPSIGNPGFDTLFSAMVAQLAIDIVFATHDSVLEYLAPRAREIGFHLVNGEPETAAVVRRKSATYGRFAGYAWVPEHWLQTEAVSRWPVVVKPDQGQGGQGVTLAGGEREAREAMARLADPILVEFLPGEELTVDCFTDRRGRLTWTGPRTRERIRAGIAMRSRLLDPEPEIEDIADAINRRLHLRGPWYFQLKRDSGGKWKLLEISCKLGAASVAQRARGVNLPLMAVADFLEWDLAPRADSRITLVDRSIATRAELRCEYDTVFVELDETLLAADSGRPLVLAFLYQAVRDGRKVKAITRRSDAHEALARARIGRELFDEILLVPDARSVADAVTPDSILVIRDSAGRPEFARRLRVPILDVDALEFFLR